MNVTLLTLLTLTLFTSSQDVMQTYFEDLNARGLKDNSNHSTVVRGTLDAYNDKTIIQSVVPLSGELLVLKWDSSLENVQVHLDNQNLPLELSTDEFGRPSFYYLNFSGNIDVMTIENQQYIFVELILGGRAYRWTDELFIDREILIINSRPSACLCQGTSQYCDSMGVACRNRDRCTTPQGNVQVCVFGYPPPPPAGPCGGPHSSIPSVPLDGIVGATVGLMPNGGWVLIGILLAVKRYRNRKR